MTTTHRWPVAILGSGNIGTELMLKILRGDGPLTVNAMVGIDPDSDGLLHARRLGVPTTAEGVEGLLGMPDAAEPVSVGAERRVVVVVRAFRTQLVDVRRP